MSNRTAAAKPPSPQGRKTGKGKRPVHPIVKSWLLDREAKNLSERSLAAYRSALQDLDLFLSDQRDDEGAPLPATPLMEVTRKDIRAWLIAMQKRNLAAATRRLFFCTARQFFRWAIEEGEVDGDPTANIAVPTLSKDVITNILTPEQYKALLSVPGTSFRARRDEAILTVMLECGLRRDEVRVLAVDDIDIDTGAITITGKGTDGGPRTRTVQMGVRARQVLDRYLRARAKRPYAEQQTALWLSSWGNGTLTRSGFQDIFLRHGKRIGVHVHPHMLRHTWASQFRKANGSEGDLMILGGWSSRAMLDRYGRADAAERARDAARKVSIVDRLR